MSVGLVSIYEYWRSIAMNRIISATILENDWGVLESNLENLQLVTLHKSPYVAILRAYLSTGFIVGNSSTSLMLALSVSSITNLSRPIPRPPVGGKPYSRAVKKSSSI